MAPMLLLILRVLLLLGLGTVRNTYSAIYLTNSGLTPRNRTSSCVRRRYLDR